MKTEDRYLKFVRWSKEDQLYVGYCPDLFPFGGVCHGTREEVAFRKLRQLVREEVADLKRERRPLPLPSTRPMREVALP